MTAMHCWDAPKSDISVPVFWPYTSLRCLRLLEQGQKGCEQRSISKAHALNPYTCWQESSPTSKALLIPDLLQKGLPDFASTQLSPLPHAAFTYLL